MTFINRIQLRQEIKLILQLAEHNKIFYSDQEAEQVRRLLEVWEEPDFNSEQILTRRGEDLEKIIG